VIVFVGTLRTEKKSTGTAAQSQHIIRYQKALLKLAKWMRMIGTCASKILQKLMLIFSEVWNDVSIWFFNDCSCGTGLQMSL